MAAPKPAGTLLTAGAAFILAALLLIGNNRVEARQAGSRAQASFRLLQNTVEQMDTLPEKKEMTVTVLEDGFGYIGCLSLPELGLELPVMEEWDYDRLRIAPCRQFGSTLSDDLVLAAHNYPEHFGRIGELSAGAEVNFTDMDGLLHSYSVAEVRELEPEAVDAVEHSGHALVLYTCTLGGGHRVAVFCDRTGAH